MTQRLILTFNPENPEQGSWVLFNNAGEILQSVANGVLSSINKIDAEVHVVISCDDVLLTTVELPKMPKARLLQALPFALEEQLLDDVQNLHFAIGEYEENQPIPVAVVSRVKMNQWITLLKNLNLNYTVLIPDIFLLPLVTPAWSVNKQEHRCLVRNGKYSGFTAETENLNAFSKQALLEITEFSDQELLEQYGNRFTDYPFINLLQKPYAIARKSTQAKKIWQLAGVLALAWIAVVLFGNIISLCLLEFKASRIESASDAIFQQHFPLETITDAKQQMQQHLRKMEQAANKNHFLILLATLGREITKSPGIRIERLDYRNGQITLAISANNFDRLDALTAALTQQGLQAKQQNSAIAGAEVKSTYLINAGGT